MEPAGLEGMAVRAVRAGLVLQERRTVGELMEEILGRKGHLGHRVHQDRRAQEQSSTKPRHHPLRGHH